MRTYFMCRWLHDHPDEPVVLYEELDERRIETRKVHEYRDGRVLRTDRVSDGNVSLGWEAIPPENEIAQKAEFEVLPLSGQDFNAVWARASDA